MNLDKILMKDNVMTQKLTHKERAIQFWSNYNMAVTDRTETLEQAFTQVANEALEEAASIVEKMTGAPLPGLSLHVPKKGIEIAAAIRAINKAQVKS